MVNVMIAEDNDAIVNSYCNYLSNDEKVRIIGIAKDGQKALELYNEKHPDLVLLDLGLPIIDGLEIINNITSTYKNKNLKNIVVISGDANLRMTLSDMRKVYMSIQKPISCEKMTRVIDEFDAELNRPIFPEEKLNKLFKDFNLKLLNKSCIYLKETIEIAFYNPSLLDTMNKLFEVTGKRNNCPSSKIQSSIQSSMRTINRCHNKELIYSIFYIHESDKKQLLSCKYFIQYIVDYLKII
jgi:two-component system, response regulator, stage 0 sporulation protein A